jgi:hypothetical protein
LTAGSGKFPGRQTGAATLLQKNDWREHIGSGNCKFPRTATHGPISQCSNGYERPAEDTATHPSTACNQQAPAGFRILLASVAGCARSRFAEFLATMLARLQPRDAIQASSRVKQRPWPRERALGFAPHGPPTAARWARGCRIAGSVPSSTGASMLAPVDEGTEPAMRQPRAQRAAVGGPCGAKPRALSRGHGRCLTRELAWMASRGCRRASIVARNSAKRLRAQPATDARSIRNPAGACWLQAVLGCVAVSSAGRS